MTTKSKVENLIDWLEEQSADNVIYAESAYDTNYNTIAKVKEIFAKELKVKEK